MKTKNYPIYLLRKNVKATQQQKVSYMQPGGLVQSPKIQNLPKWMLVHYKTKPKHIYGYNATGKSV